MQTIGCTQMMEKYMDSKLENSAEIDNRNRPGRSDLYDYYAFNEQSSPELVETALKVHAEGYTTMGFVSSDAVGPDGKLVQQIDHSRGENVDYFLLIDPGDLANKATVRKINLLPGLSLENLPGYQLTKGGLYLQTQEYFDELLTQGFQIKEISGLARTKDAPPAMVYELLRDLLHNSLTKNEAWFFSIVSSTLDSLTKYLGKSAFEILGDAVNINDHRVNEIVSLVPALLLPDKFLDNLLDDIGKESSSTRESKKLIGMFLYMSEGLERGEISDDVYNYRQNILDYLSSLEK